MNDARRTVDSLIHRARAVAGVTDTSRDLRRDGGNVDWTARNSDARRETAPAGSGDEALPGWEGRDGLARAITGLLGAAAPRRPSGYSLQPEIRGSFRPGQHVIVWRRPFCTSAVRRRPARSGSER